MISKVWCSNSNNKIGFDDGCGGQVKSKKAKKLLLLLVCGGGEAISCIIIRHRSSQKIGVNKKINQHGHTVLEISYRLI